MNMIFETVFAIFSLINIGSVCLFTFGDIKSRPVFINIAFIYVFGIVVISLIGLFFVIYGINIAFYSFFCLILINIICFLLNIVRFKANIVYLFLNKMVIYSICLIVFTVIFLTNIANLNVKFPDVLPDGPYVFKQHDKNVKIQLMTGNLPADNYIPYVVREYLLNEISFKKYHPILPGQEIVNRPILASLFSVPFAAINWDSSNFKKDIPIYNYSGTNYPDAQSLYLQSNFDNFLVTAILLNSLVVVGFFSIAEYFKLKPVLVVLGSLLLITGPYFISQIIFTWPKSMAAFFILVSAAIYLNKYSFKLIGILLGLAYLSHPYACVFLISNTLVELYLNRKKIYLGFNIVYQQCIGFFSVTFPWFIWTNFYLKINSDLITQNLFSSSTLVNFIWVRIYNLYNLLTPRFLTVYPFNGDVILQQYIVTLPGVVGVVIYFLSLNFIFKNKVYLDKFFVSFAILPSLLLTFVFSNPSVPALHGIQAVGIPFIIYGLLRLNEVKNKLIICSLICLQFSVSIYLINSRYESIFLKDKIIDSYISDDSHLSIDLFKLSDFEVINNSGYDLHKNVNITINNLSKNSLWLNPPAQYRINNIQLDKEHKEPKFFSYVAIHPHVWGQSNADGSNFIVSILKDNKLQKREVFNVNPFLKPNQQDWNEVGFSLVEFSGQNIDIILEVDDGGKSNNYADWCLWSNSIIYY